MLNSLVTAGCSLVGSKQLHSWLDPEMSGYLAPVKTDFGHPVMVEEGCPCFASFNQRISLPQRHYSGTLMTRSAKGLIGQSIKDFLQRMVRNVVSAFSIVVVGIELVAGCICCTLGNVRGMTKKTSRSMGGDARSRASEH